MFQGSSSQPPILLRNPLEQQRAIGGDLRPREHCAMFTDVLLFLYYTPGSKCVEARDVSRHPTVTGTAPNNRELSGQNIYDAKIKKFDLEYSRHFVIQPLLEYFPWMGSSLPHAIRRGSAMKPSI